MSSSPVRTALAVLSISLSVGACSQTDAAPAPDPVPIIDWSDPTVVADLDAGWTVAACEGGARLLCVARDGVVVGLVELISFPVSSFSDVEPSRPVAENMAVIGSGFVQAMTEDRSAGCGPDYELTPFELESFSLGSLEGASFGYEGRWSDGRPSELNLQYGTIVGDSIVFVVAAAYDEGGCPGRDDTSAFDSATLAEFRPHLERLLSGNEVPGD